MLHRSEFQLFEYDTDSLVSPANFDHLITDVDEEIEILTHNILIFGINNEQVNMEKMNFVSRFVVLLVFLSTLVIVRGHPAELTTNRITAGDISLETKPGKGNEPIIALDAAPAFNNIQSSQMDRFFANIGSVLSAMSNRINKLFSRLPPNYDGNVVVPLTNFQIPTDVNIDFGKANSTSVTKFVNGHKVTINDTEYRNEAANETSFFHVRVVDIHPDNYNGTVPQDIVEEVKNEFAHEMEEENAIPNNNVDEVPQLNPYSPLKIQKRKDTEWSEEEWNNNAQPLDLQNIETFDEKSSGEYQPPMRDLSNDIYVNEILANSGAPMDPNAEFIKKDPIPPFFVRQNNKAEVPSPKSNYYYYDVVPMKPIVDLSNDIYVNEIMENSGAPTNPDAELIDSKTLRQPRSFENANP